jgi:hypothetical protein
MKNEFSTGYLALLRKQVEEEIQFLITNGHSYENHVSCMFCTDNGIGMYNCGRERELKRLLWRILSHGSNKLRNQHERKRIGYELPQEPLRTFNSSHHNDLPLLFPEL